MNRMLLQPPPSDQARTGAPGTQEECDKVPYPTPARAWRAILILTHKTALLTHKRLHQRCTAYPCEICHHWHITRQHRDRPVDWIRRRWALIERETRP